MKRRTLLASMGAAALAALPPTLGVAQNAPISLDEISRYFNSFRTAQADFTQVNPDGSISTGRLMIHRPGRVRFEYDAPDRSLVLAAGGSVNIFDARSNTEPSSYPLSRTPLNLILDDTVNLSRERMVVEHYADGPTTVVVAQDPQHPEYGSIRLVFSADPTELRQWVVTDDTGRETTVILGTLRTGVSLGAMLFSIDLEMQRRGLRSNR
ncbi:LolA family protein [Pararhodobacter marinus]|uniref:Cell envelope biogenesis protein LolA n=1 Tax=Pararhodobacter marinus TaxID=2184063 RepID=A0A2U2CI22_9RHOB|nr:outer membrane lipoprotein carrier protein LolA [Pararhodobacter marinus]PWE31528.1 cell envelope biogenesis protein LolA [Pararhodobacter marinus]